MALELFSVCQTLEIYGSTRELEFPAPPSETKAEENIYTCWKWNYISWNGKPSFLSVDTYIVEVVVEQERRIGRLYILQHPIELQIPWIDVELTTDRRTGDGKWEGKVFPSSASFFSFHSLWYIFSKGNRNGNGWWINIIRLNLLFFNERNEIEQWHTEKWNFFWGKRKL
jgi:hypothetical protein